MIKRFVKWLFDLEEKQEKTVVKRKPILSQVDMAKRIKDFDTFTIHDVVKEEAKRRKKVKKEYLTAGIANLTKMGLLTRLGRETHNGRSVMRFKVRKRKINSYLKDK